MKKRFIRARKPEQKDVRRAQLLTTARAMLEESGDLRALSLNELARRAGMAKANVYRYFETREAVLLELLRAEMAGYFARIAEPLATRGRGPLELTALVDRLAVALSREPLLCALLAALPSVLEQNLSDEVIRTFKREARDGLLHMGTLLSARSPALDAEQWAGLLDDAATVMAGIHPATHPSPAAARVLADPAMKPWRKDFADELRRYLRALAIDRASRSPTGRRAR